jgi:hypothetical protein
MRDEARREFERNYTGEKNYELLIHIYQQTIARYASGRSSANDNIDLVQIAGGNSSRRPEQSGHLN